MTPVIISAGLHNQLKSRASNRTSGELVMTGANSAVGLRSTPTRYLFLDEVDGYPGDADGEGDPVALAIGRTMTFKGMRKVFMASTPTLKGHSRIEAAYQESDQRRYYVPCRRCGAWSPIEWAAIHWPEGERQRACWVCPASRVCPPLSTKSLACSVPALATRKGADDRRVIGSFARGNVFEWLVRQHEGRSTAKGDGRTAGFHLSALYSPWLSWAEAAIEQGSGLS